jgi:hypothetical protein
VGNLSRWATEFIQRLASKSHVDCCFWEYSQIRGVDDLLNSRTKAFLVAFYDLNSEQITRICLDMRPCHGTLF